MVVVKSFFQYSKTRGDILVLILKVVKLSVWDCFSLIFGNIGKFFYRKGGMKMLMGAEILCVPGGFQKSVRPRGRA